MSDGDDDLSPGVPGQIVKLGRLGSSCGTADARPGLSESRVNAAIVEGGCVLDELLVLVIV